MLNTVLTTLFDKLDECPRIKALLAGSKELVRYFKKSGLMQHLKTALKKEMSIPDGTYVLFAGIRFVQFR